MEKRQKEKRKRHEFDNEGEMGTEDYPVFDGNTGRNFGCSCTGQLCGQAEFPLTGFSGIALIFNRLFGLPLGATIVVLNIPLALLCYKLLGKGFFLLFYPLYDYIFFLHRLYRADVPGI